MQLQMATDLGGDESATSAVHISSSIPSSPSAVRICSSNSEEHLQPNASMLLPPIVGGKPFVDPVGEAMLLAMGMSPPSPDDEVGGEANSALAIVPQPPIDLIGVIVPRAPSVATQLLGDLPVLAKAKAKAQAKATAKTRATPKAARGKAKPKAKPKAIKDRASAPEPAAAKAPGKRNRAGIQDESTRQTMRARLTDGTSKGFKYTDDADRARARTKAEEFIKSNGEEI